MDSGNSGSIQSSSGGDDDYDSSRAADSSSFSNQVSSTTTINNNINQVFYNSQSSAMFDPLSNYLNQPISSQPQTHNSNSFLNLDMAAPNSSAPFYKTTQTGNNNLAQVGARNPKKRSRASRRAPTTVLTTDTSNFRAMVQEFTGIPSPPFTSSSSLPFPTTSRLDLFASPTPSSLRSQPSNFQQYDLLRPFSESLKPPHQNSTSSNYNLVNDMHMQNLRFGSFHEPASSNDPFGLASPTTHLPYNDLMISSSPRKNKDHGSGGYNFTAEKRKLADNISASTTRATEGLMESWICSSD